VASLTTRRARRTALNVRGVWGVRVRLVRSQEKAPLSAGHTHVDFGKSTAVRLDLESCLGAYNVSSSPERISIGVAA
jgi:hypothetical protein